MSFSLLQKNKLFFPQDQKIPVYHYILDISVNAQPVSHVWEDDNDYYVTCLFDHPNDPSTQTTWNCIWNEHDERWETVEA